MGMTITEKILAAHAGKDRTMPGEIVEANVDIIFGCDDTSAMGIERLESMGYDCPFDKDSVVYVMDHFTPNVSRQAAEQVKKIRDFSRRNGIQNFFDVGDGIEHQLLPEQGLVRPGMIVVGADSHTCTYGFLGAFSTGIGSSDQAVALATGKIWFKVPPTIKIVFRGALPDHTSGKDLILHVLSRLTVDGALYKALEFAGETIDNLSMDSRLTLCNMAVEVGAKNGIIAPDAVTERYVRERSNAPYQVFASDPDARYEAIHEFDISGIEPLVALPHSPDNICGVSDAPRFPIDQVFIGSCTNSGMEDISKAAAVVKGKKIAKGVRFLITPGTRSIFQEASRKGYIQDLLDAGACLYAPTCGPCFGGHTGLLASNERCVSTGCRNFEGRMGPNSSEVYLSNPEVAAATAISGYIIHPREVM